jgi:hypothetical protein
VVLRPRLLLAQFEYYAERGHLVVAFDLAAHYPRLTSAVDMLDAAVVLPSGVRGTIPGFLEELRGPDYREALRR